MDDKGDAYRILARARKLGDAWQAVGLCERIMDYSCLQLLRSLIWQHQNTLAARNGTRVVEELRSRTSVTYLEPINSWQPATYDYFRWKIAEAIMGFGQ